MEPVIALQQILGTDKRNPVFTVCRDGVGGVLHVYYGGELLEEVADDREHAQYKLLVARLYNAGVNARILQEVFGASRKTMKRWGDALKCGDSQRLARVLAGRGAQRKLTEPIQSYVRMRFGAIYRETRYEYRSRVLEEIEQVFAVRLSGETIRPLLKALKREAQSAKEATACDCATVQGDAEEQREASIANDSKEMCMRPYPQDETQSASNRKESPTSCQEPSPRLTLCHHVGVLLFHETLRGVEAWVESEAEEQQSGAWLVKQWLAAILLGAVNIEQTKLLDFDDLRMLLGRTLRLTHGQRTELGRLATTETAACLFRFNAQQVKASDCADFYYDPHTKHYTGISKVLKGWCPGIRLADKALHMDFIHTAGGCPVYLEPTDNYEDLRERFMKTVRHFRALTGVGEQKALTFVVDRGIYAYAVFKEIIESPSCHLITWEKGYKAGSWDAADVDGAFAMQRPRNRAADVQTYSFEYIDAPWRKDQRMRLLRVRATNPKGTTVEVGVLSDDRERNAQDIIVLIFQRWIQENDFKYLDTHFGINEITTYATIPYNELQGHVTQKDMKSGEYKALEVTRAELRKKLAKLLLREHEHPRTNKKRTEQIQELTRGIEQTAEQLATTQKEVSRLEFLIEQAYVRLDTRNKHVMDAIKLIARNAFYALFAPFKQRYDNYRDDHVLFRNLTQASGVLIEQADTVEAILLPTAHCMPKTRRIIERVLEEINASGPEMPDGSGRQLRFRLGKKEEIQLAIHQSPNRTF